MAIALEEIDDVAIEEDLGYFFKRLGEICFSSASNQSYNAPLNSIATAGRCGAVFFSDSTGVYTARTSDVLANIQKWNGEGELNPHQASSICKSVLPTAGPASASISPDEALLAICQGPEVQVFSTKHLVTESKCIPLAVFHLPADFKQFAWQPDSSLPSFLVVCTDGALLSGSTASTALSKLPAGPKGSVACAAWSPSGRQLGVGSGDLLTVCKADGGECFSVRITSQEMDEEEEGKDNGSLLKVDSLHWLSETAILVSSKLLEDEEQVDIAPQCVVSWQGDPPKASGVHLSEFFAPNINVSCAEGDGPWLHVAAVQPWSTVVYCHRKSNDDHIKVAALLGGIPVAADITDDKLAIRIPNGPDDEENYVVGLGFDFTSTQIEVQHPTDPNAEDLPPQPVLFVGTSDGVLRAYTFGNMSSPTSIVSAALPLPGPPPDLAGPAEGSAITAVGTGGAGAARPGAELEGKAAATALPSDDEEEDWEQVEREEGGDQAAKAAGVALPSSDDSESDLEEEDSSTGETTAAAAAAGSKPVFAFATSAAVAPAPVSAAPAAPAQSFGSAPLGGSAAASPAAPSFGFATSAVGAEPKGTSGSKPPQAVAPSTPAFSWPSASSASMFRATSAAASSASLFGATSASLFSASSAGSTTSAFGGTSSAPDSLATLSQAAFPLSPPAPPSVVTPLGATQPVPPPPPPAAGATPPGSEPASGLPPQAESVASQASSRAVSEQEGTTVTSQGNLPAEPAEPAKPAFKKTSVERPAAKLQGECPEAAELEADFLLSLHHTRKLEAQLHDAMAAALQHGEGPGSYAGFLQLRCQTQELEREVRALTDSLARQKAQFGAASHQVKDAHRKCDALPSFTPSRPGGDAGGSWELLMSQPLEPPLANLRGGIKAQLVGLGRKSQELRECLDALEDRQRQYKSGDSVPQKLTNQQLYNAVNSQVAIVKAQSERLEALSQLARSQGLGWEEGWEEGLGLLEGPNAGVQLQLEALRLGESTLQGGGKRTPGSGGKCRSPWRLVRESPLSARRPSPLASSSGTPTQPAGSGAPFPSSRLSPAPRLGGEWRGWDHPGSKAVVQQILERVKSEEGGVRITASKPKPPPLELQRNVARSASPPTTSDAEAAQVSAPEPPREPPILPPFSLSSVPSLPPATQPSTGGAGGKLAAEQPPFPSTASAALGAGAGFGALGTPGSAAFGFSAPPASATSNGKPAYFIPSSAFQGAKPGYVFKLDGSGVGYYQDLPLPTAGSIFGKGSSKPASEPGKPPAPQAAPKQPPIPSMAQVKAAGEQMQKVLGGGAAGGGAKEASQKVPKPPAAAAPKAGGSLPPIPSLAQVAQAQKLIEKVAPTSAPAQPPPSSTPAPKQPPPAARPSSQPPIPSMAAAQAAQQRLGSFLSSPSTTPPAAQAPATTQAQQAQKQPSGPAGGALQQGSGDGGALQQGSGDGGALAGGAGKVEDAQQAQQGAPAAELNFGGMGLGVGAAGSGGSPFGRGVSFGAAPTAGVASSAALFSTATSGPGGSAPFPFGTASSAAASGFGTSASGAGISAPSLFGAASSAAASPFGATSSAATSPFGAASSAAASSFGVPSPSNPFGATQSQAGGGSAASPFGKPASPASPFGTSTGFGQPATPGFGAPATPGFGAPATPGFGKPATPGFGAPATPGFGQAATPGFGQAATPGFGQVATPGFGQAATPGFGQAATPGFGQPAAFGSAATAGAGGGSVFGAAGGAAPGGVFGGGNAFGAFAQQGGAVGGGFGQQQQQQQQQAGGGFGAFGGSATFPAGPKPGGNPSMWAMRK